MEPQHYEKQLTSPFLFPKTNSTVRSLFSSPLPANSFFQNFTVKAGDQAEYIHPLIRKILKDTIEPWLEGAFRNQESTSDAVNAYYSEALMGLAYADNHLLATGSLPVSMGIHAAQTCWHVRKQDTLLGILLLPLLPITEVLFSDVEFARELVRWTLTRFSKRGKLENGWKGFVYALEGNYDKENGSAEE
ncbi:hypothetical protein Patl1_21523 [Pistacia atlantica]|uniref:Uncharacterized protein n=1 Tax=Pistacia atlantica TaxID=434234 RepID=A0ACC1BKU0_9ROSI|nr:hypothetical protein Patl1_21523 [Pistacia atlantica]